jgi:hypothetical protein
MSTASSAISGAPSIMKARFLEAVVSAKWDKAAALKFLKRATRTYGDRGASSQTGLLGDERDRQCRSPGGRSAAQQSRGEFDSAVSTTRMGHAAVSKHEDTAKFSSVHARSTTISIRSAISSPAKLTNKDEVAHWPSGALSRTNGGCPHV